MKIRNLNYFLAEGFKSFWTNGLMSLASTMIVIASLLIFGIYILFSINVTNFADNLKDQYEIQVYINENTSEEDINALQDKIKSIKNVSEIHFISKEEGFKDFKKQLGDSGDILEGLENDNPLRDSLRVILKDLSKSQETADTISKMDNVGKVNNNKSITDKIVNITTIVKNVSFWFMILLSIIAIFIISNTIKITVFARRKDINIMKYLGATDTFISLPFVVEGIVIGILGAGIALGIVCWGYNYLNGVIQASAFSLVKIVPLNNIIYTLVAWFALIGAGLGAIGSAISLRKHLHV